MAKKACTIKGTRHGLAVKIPTGIEISQVVEDLEGRLASAGSFFRGASISIQGDTGALEPEDKEMIVRTIEEYGLVLVDVEEDPVKEGSAVKEENAQKDQMGYREEAEDEQTLLVRRTLRSGQNVHYDGNVVVLGDVNPGAEIVCSGDIVVLGSLRGVAHAGAKGKTDAVVIAFRLEPTQLRIAHFISRAPDEKVPHPAGPEKALVKDNIIQINAYQ